MAPAIFAFLDTDTARPDFEIPTSICIFRNVFMGEAYVASLFETKGRVLSRGHYGDDDFSPNDLCCVGGVREAFGRSDLSDGGCGGEERCGKITQFRNAMCNDIALK